MSDYISVEVILEILKRLPVKSLVRFRSVCKAWNSLICSSYFISTHLQASLPRQPNNTPFLLLRYWKNSKENYFLCYDNDVFDEFKQLQFPVFDGVFDSIVIGSCNGLICLNFFPVDSLKFLIWNPSIQKYIPLPRPTTYILWAATSGFGFDSRTNDYKLLVVGVDKNDTLNIDPFLFSLNENCWRRVVNISPHYNFNPQTSMPFVNGAVHVLGYQTRNNDVFSNVILGFDFSAEEFFEISLPESLIDVCLKYLSTMKYGESSIAVLREDWEDGGLHELWVMKEYGVVESWTKVLTLNMDNHYGWILKVLGFRKNGEVLLQVDGEMASLDLNSQQRVPHGVEVGSRSIYSGSYAETLVLLDRAVDVHSVSLEDLALDSSDSDE